MDRLVLIVGAVAVAGVVALAVDRIRSGSRSSAARSPAAASPAHHVPDRLDRGDFARPDAGWLVAVFTSDTCSTCAEVWQLARKLEGPEVAAQQIEAKREAALHARYGIDAVPLTVIADRDGVTQRSIAGPTTEFQLRTALAEAAEDTDPRVF